MNDAPDRPSDAVISELRATCLAFPEAYEAESFGHPTFRVRKRTFAGYEPYDDTWCVTFKTTPLDQERLVQGTDAFFIAPYVGRFGWVCLRQHAIDWAEFAPMLLGSYRLVAPKSLSNTVVEMR